MYCMSLSCIVGNVGTRIERKRNDCNEKGNLSGSALSIRIICFLNKYYWSALPDQRTAFQNTVATLHTMQL